VFPEIELRGARIYTGKTLFAQIMDFLPWSTFHRIVQRYAGNHRVRTLSCAEQFRALAFAQLTYGASLRDGAFYVLDRGYLAWERLHVLDQAGSFFIIRAKSNMNAHRLYSSPADRSDLILKYLKT
jgi:Domain of unknown function (DUF4372)